MITTEQLSKTNSTANIYALLRKALLEFVGPNGVTLKDIIGERMYVARAPDQPVFPYATIRLTDQQRLGEYQGLRKTAMLEIIFVGRPWLMLSELEHSADLIEQAFLSFRQTRDGLVFSRSSARETITPMTAPADAEVCMVRLVANVILWPQYLTRYTTTL